MVTSVAVGAPAAAFPDPVAPIAPEPLVPVMSTPLKLTTVMEDSTFCDRVAVTVTPESSDGAKARQISASPPCTFVLDTNAHVNPAPVMPVTVVLGEEAWSVEMNASNNSLPVVVENEEVVMEVLGAAPSPELVASI